MALTNETTPAAQAAAPAVPGAAAPIMALLKAANDFKASDLHLVAGAKPTMRIAKELVPFEGKELSSKEIEGLLYPVMEEWQRKKFNAETRLNFVFSLPSLGRCRVCIYKAKGEVGAALRLLSLPVKPLEQLGLPPSVMPMLHRRAGIIFVTGATGSGKSTTLASIVDFINRGKSPCKILTIEDPIEYEHPAGVHGIVVQREVGTDTPSFSHALHDALRLDPNIIVIGELREADAILTALTAAETGHLVMTTLHTPDAPGIVNRLISTVPPAQQEQARMMLAATLQMVICQELIAAGDKKNVVLLPEVLIATDVVRRLIREGKPEQIYDIMQTGTAQGMVSKDMALVTLVKKGQITKEQAIPRMRNPQLLDVQGNK
jgi:twitching motility protein PilT